MGRWSRLIAARFVEWLALPAGGIWLDVCCGTGGLTAAICEMAAPVAVVGVDSSSTLVSQNVDTCGETAAFEVADAQELPFDAGIFDAVVSGLALNFLADPIACLREQSRVTASWGTVAAYVWDYAEGMRLLRHFWDVAEHIAPSAVALDEAVWYPQANAAGLERLFETAGLASVEVASLEVEGGYRDFDELWATFQSGQGPAPRFVAGLDDDTRVALRDALGRALPTRPDGSIHLSARAWTARGKP